MPITLQKRSNILCLAVHFRPLGADKDPQSQKSCRKSEIFVFATDRSLRQERNPTNNAWTPLARAKVQTPPHKASRQNHASQQGQQGRICERHRVLTTTAGQNPRNSYESQRGQQDILSERRGGAATCNDSGADPAKLTRLPTAATGRISRRRAATIGDRKARQGGAIQIRCARQRRVRRNFSADPSKKINRYAIEASHSTMQLFRNGLESGASALTMRNLASPSAVFQTSVRRRTPGRTGDVKRHLKRVIASGRPGNNREIAWRIATPALLTP